MEANTQQHIASVPPCVFLLLPSPPCQLPCQSHRVNASVPIAPIPPSLPLLPILPCQSVSVLPMSVSVPPPSVSDGNLWKSNCGLYRASLLCCVFPFCFPQCDIDAVLTCPFLFRKRLRRTHRACASVPIRPCQCVRASVSVRVRPCQCVSATASVPLRPCKCVRASASGSVPQRPCQCVLASAPVPAHPCQWVRTLVRPRQCCRTSASVASVQVRPS